jgi:hypothetical protein
VVRGTLDNGTRVFVGHDYQTGGRELSTLGMPNLIVPALQVNLRGGEMPRP